MTYLNLIGQTNTSIESAPGTSQPQRNITCAPRLDINYIMSRHNVRFSIRKKGKLNSSTCCFADVNECATGKHNCNGSSKCNNTKGSFRCICREQGYFWNGVNCTGKYLLYIDIVDSSDKKGRCVIGVCHMMKSLSLSLSLISRLFPLLRV